MRLGCTAAGLHRTCAGGLADERQAGHLARGVRAAVERPVREAGVLQRQRVLQAVTVGCAQWLWCHSKSRGGEGRSAPVASKAIRDLIIYSRPIASHEGAS